MPSCGKRRQCSSPAWITRSGLSWTLAAAVGALGDHTGPMDSHPAARNMGRILGAGQKKYWPIDVPWPAIEIRRRRGGAAARSELSGCDPQVFRLLGSVAISSSQNASKQSSQTGSFKGKSSIRGRSRRPLGHPPQMTQALGLRSGNGITFFIARLF